MRGDGCRGSRTTHPHNQGCSFGAIGKAVGFRTVWFGALRTWSGKEIEEMASYFACGAELWRGRVVSHT